MVLIFNIIVFTTKQCVLLFYIRQETIKLIKIKSNKSNGRLPENYGYATGL